MCNSLQKIVLPFTLTLVHNSSLMLKLFCTLFTCNFQFPAAKRLKIERFDEAYIGMLDFLKLDSGDLHIQYMLLSGYCLYWCPVKWNGAFQTKTNTLIRHPAKNQNIGCHIDFVYYVMCVT